QSLVRRPALHVFNAWLPSGAEERKHGYHRPLCSRRHERREVLGGPPPSRKGGRGVTARAAAPCLLRTERAAHRRRYLRYTAELRGLRQDLGAHSDRARGASDTRRAPGPEPDRRSLSGGEHTAANRRARSERGRPVAAPAGARARAESLLKELRESSRGL